jgi:hypothetical protein
MIKLITILNELKLNDLVGNQYKYVIGSSEEKYIGENDKKYVLEMIEKSLKTYLYDSDFALNYLDGSQQKEYNSFFEREVLTPMLKKVDFTLNNFFVLDGDKVKWKFSSNDTRKMVDEIFRKNSKVPSDIKKEYYEYRLEYAGVKLKEGVTEETKRDYKAEYKKFQSSTEAKKYRAELNKYNRDKGTYGNGDGKDASHKNGKIVGFEDETANRGRAEKSRLKKEGVNEETPSEIIKDLDKVKNDLIKKVDVLIAKKKKLYSNIDIESPMSADEKQLDKDIQSIFSQIQQIILKKRTLKESINEESYKVAGRPVTLIKGKKSDGTDWKVAFQNGKETSLSDVLALIKPFPKDVHWRYKNLESVNEANPAVVGNVNAFGPSKVLGKGGKVLGFVPDTPNAIATLIQDYPNVQAIEFKSPFFFDFNSYKSIKKGDKAWKELMSRGVDNPTKAALKKDFQLNESELKGYLIADVVDDIIKVIGPRFVSGEIKQSDKNKIYLKLTDVKVGTGVVKLLKSKFGIDAKEEMFGGKDKFGSIPSVSFFANKVINEKNDDAFADYLSTRKSYSPSVTWKVIKKDGKYSFESDDRSGRVRLMYNGKQIAVGVNDWSTGGYEIEHSSWKNKEKPFQFAKDVIDYFKSKKLTTESVNEASMPPVRKVVNAILKKHGIVPMKTTSTSVRGFHNIQRGGYRYEGDLFLGFYGGVTQDIIDKVGAEMKKAGVKDVDVRRGIISADFTKTGLNEAAFKSPDFIVTSIPADAIPQTNISKADVGLGLSMFDALGRGWTLNNKDYKLDYHNGKVALKLTSSGKTAVRVKSGHDPKYVQKIEKFANDYLSKYAKDIKK